MFLAFFWQWISTLDITGIPNLDIENGPPNASSCPRMLWFHVTVPGEALFQQIIYQVWQTLNFRRTRPFLLALHLSNISDCWSMAPSRMYWSIIHNRNASLHESSLLPVTGMRWQPLTHLFDSAFSLPKLLKLLLLGWAFVSLLLGWCMVGRVQPRHIVILRTRNSSWIGGGIPDTSLLQLVKWKLSSKCPRNVTLTIPLPRICRYKKKCHVWNYCWWKKSCTTWNV